MSPATETEVPYWIVPRGTPVMWVPLKGKPYRGESSFFMYEDDGLMVMFVGRGEFHHTPNEFEEALADRGYWGLWFEPLSGFPDVRSVWFDSKRAKQF